VSTPFAPQPGTVYLIGAGPGAPDLMTLRGRAIIERADLILFADSLVRPEVCAGAKPGATVLGSAALTLDEVVDLLAGAAQAGKVVARVHSGDPSVYGAIHEQLAALEARGVRCEVVPGVSSAFAAAAAVGCEMTVPGVTQTVIFTRASGRASPVPTREALRDLAAHGASMAIFLSAALVKRVVAELRAGGYADDTPVVVAYRVTWPDEAVIRTTLGDTVAAVRAAGWTTQVLFLVGPAFAPRSALADQRSRLYDPSYHHLFRRPRRSAGQAKYA
jgi:precorrin-4/cobalt-precorrin-4 C11-methyltransferase